MSESAPASGLDAPVAAQPSDAPEVEQASEVDWKAKSREWERRAKANADAAKRLSDMEEAQKSAEQKAQEREKAAIERAEVAERRAVRQEVALEFRLSREDASLLDAVSDKDALQALAKRLAAAESDKRHTNHVPREGSNPRPDGGNPWSSVLRELDRR